MSLIESTYLRAGLLALILVLPFAPLGGDGGSGGGPDTSGTRSCSIGTFGTAINETQGTVIISCNAVTWANLTGFPSGCAANQFVIAVGASLTCSAVSWTGLVNFPAGCAIGKFVTGVGVTLTCTSVAWSQITGFPSGCPAGQFVTGVGVTLSCGTTVTAGLTPFTINNGTFTQFANPPVSNVAFKSSSRESTDFVQHIGCGSCSDTITVNVAVNDAVNMVWVDRQNQAQNPVCSDSAGNTWTTTIFSPGIGGPGTNLAMLCTAIATVASATDTLKVAWTSSLGINNVVMEDSIYTGATSYGTVIGTIQNVPVGNTWTKSISLTSLASTTGFMNLLSGQNTQPMGGNIATWNERTTSLETDASLYADMYDKVQGNSISAVNGAGVQITVLSVGFEMIGSFTSLHGSISETTPVTLQGAYWFNNTVSLSVAVNTTDVSVSITPALLRLSSKSMFALLNATETATVPATHNGFTINITATTSDAFEPVYTKIAVWTGHFAQSAVTVNYGWANVLGSKVQPKQTTASYQLYMQNKLATFVQATLSTSIRPNGILPGSQGSYPNGIAPVATINASSVTVAGSITHGFTLTVNTANATIGDYTLLLTATNATLTQYELVMFTVSLPCPYGDVYDSVFLRCGLLGEMIQLYHNETVVTRTTSGTFTDFTFNLPLNTYSNILMGTDMLIQSATGLVGVNVNDTATWQLVIGGTTVRQTTITCFVTVSQNCNLAGAISFEQPQTAAAVLTIRVTTVFGAQSTAKSSVDNFRVYGII